MLSPDIYYVASILNYKDCGPLSSNVEGCATITLLLAEITTKAKFFNGQEK